MDRAGSVSSLFRACDLDGSGFIDQSELAVICSDLSGEELKDIFEQLDKDGDGKISVDEFSSGFKEITGAAIKERKSRIDSSNSLDDTTLEEFIGGLDDGLRALSCQEQVCDLYQQLHGFGNPEVIEAFETVILGVLKDVRQYQMETDRLERSFKREKDQHERHLRQLEDEMEIQMQKVEDRVRKDEQQKTENEKTEMREKVEEEIRALQQNLTKLQEEGPEAKNKEIEDQLLTLKGKVEEVNYANRQLRSELSDAQTNLALAKGELVTAKQQLNERIHEYEVLKEANSEYIREHDNLTRQLHLLHDANKKLHDTNDDLREAFDVTRRTSPMRQLSNASNASTIGSLPQRERKGSLMSDYFSVGMSGRPRTLSAANSVDSLTSSNQNVSVIDASHPYSPKLIHVPRLSHQDTCEEDSVIEDIDSGHSTLREGNGNDAEQELDPEEVRRAAFRKVRRPRQFTFSEDIDSHDDLDTENEGQMENRHYRTLLEQRRLTAAGRAMSRRSVSGRGDSAMARSRKQSSSQENVANRLSKEPERMFKVVLAGDAAVGKSSLIMRLCKGKFVPNLSSTLGVDFQTKMIDLDGRTIALQLWDTAGQERFRSIAKSYFRRADGVLLLYDCTYERSFLSIREWIESIESSQDGAIKKLPIMMCGNKTDVRAEAEKQGRKIVTYEDGQRLARENSALFIETSAKEGSNVLECVTELARLMRANEDLEVKTAGLQLHDKGSEKNKGCCGR